MYDGEGEDDVTGIPTDVIVYVPRQIGDRYVPIACGAQLSVPAPQAR